MEKGESPVPVTSFHGTSSGSTATNPQSSRPCPRRRAFALPAGNATQTCPPSRARKRGKRPRQPWQEMPDGPNSIFTLGEPGLTSSPGFAGSNATWVDIQFIGSRGPSSPRLYPGIGSPYLPMVTPPTVRYNDQRKSHWLRYQPFGGISPAGTLSFAREGNPGPSQVHNFERSQPARRFREGSHMQQGSMCALHTRVPSAACMQQQHTHRVQHTCVPTCSNARVPE